MKPESRTRSEPLPSLDEKAERLADLIRAERPRALARLRRGLSFHEAADVYQDACVRALQCLSQQRGRTRLAAWFHAVLRSTLAARGRRVARRLEWPLLEEPFLEPAFGGGGPCDCGRRALERLRPSYRRAIQRAIVDDHPIAAIVANEGITASNARVRLHRARAALRNEWTCDCGRAPRPKTAPWPERRLLAGASQARERVIRARGGGAPRRLAHRAVEARAARGDRLE